MSIRMDQIQPIIDREYDYFMSEHPHWSLTKGDQDLHQGAECRHPRGALLIGGHLAPPSVRVLAVHQREVLGQVLWGGLHVERPAGRVRHRFQVLIALRQAPVGVLGHEVVVFAVNDRLNLVHADAHSVSCSLGNTSRLARTMSSGKSISIHGCPPIFSQPTGTARKKASQVSSYSMSSSPFCTKGSIAASMARESSRLILMNPTPSPIKSGGSFGTFFVSATTRPPRMIAIRSSES